MANGNRVSGVRSRPVFRWMPKITLLGSVPGGTRRVPPLA